MPEINNVQIGETIAVEWGNAIRDRTIQRYANAAERDELHPTPAEGDLSYLEDTNSIEVFDGFTWVAGIPNGAVTAAKIAGAAIAAFERSAATVATDVNVPSASAGNLATVTLNIPPAWSSWECVAFAQATATPLGDLAVLSLHARIDGTDGANFTYQLQGPPPLNGAVVAASFRSGITTTGNRTIALRGVRGSTGVTLGTVFLYARAFRTS